MNIEMVKEQALIFSGVYNFMQLDLQNYVHDLDAHNLCSAIVEHHSKEVCSLFSYSNPSSLPKWVKNRYDFVIGDVGNMLINRGGMQDLHTEVRLINHLFNGNLLKDGTVVTFFSMRSVCTTCRRAIWDTMERLNGWVGLNAMEFKVERYGSVTDRVFPILGDTKEQQEGVQYV